MWTKNKIRPLLDSEIVVYHSFFTPEECREIVAELSDELEQSGQQNIFYGKQTDRPNSHELNAHCHKPLPWTNTLLDIKQFIEDRLDLEFDTATLTKNYRGEQHFETVAALLSFGGSRTFRLGWKDLSKAAVTRTLHEGSLLLVKGEVQADYSYRLSMPIEHPPLINLVFGRICSAHCRILPR
ncbi:MAG: hypothetical protein Q8943_02265 [Bacteroidota bacterium]|nr:hypothetical protein [Bacteroidota bacterium]